MEPLFFILAILILFVVTRLAAGSLDRERVDGYLRARGDKLISAEWQMFGAGWGGDKNRIYRVHYLTAQGEERIATCKTKALSGVYFTDDEPVSPAEQAPAGLPAADAPNAPPFLIHGLDHVQLAMPAGQEDAARHFYRDLLGLREMQKPANLAARGGVWFAGGSLKLHLGVEANFTPARKAHPALLVQNLPALIAVLECEGVPVITDEPLEGYSRVYVADPFGNRVELLEPV